MINLLADASMPALAQLVRACQQAGMALQLETFSGRQPDAFQLARAQVLLIRSITQVTKELLDQAPHVCWIGTATIGTEHVDASACQARGIKFVSTPGVNAQAVGDYVASAVAALTLAQDAALTGPVAIIGGGHTGQAAGARLQGLGYQVHCYDPPLVAQGISQRDGMPIHANWQQVLASAAISCHVPLTRSGPFATYHLLDDASIAQLPANCVLINASRGPVVAESALRAAANRQQPLRVVLDVWEHEPQIATDLLPWLSLATMHIAGHSMAGKVAGTLQLLQQLLSWLPSSELAQASGTAMPVHELPDLIDLLQAWPTSVQPQLWQANEAPDWRTLASWVLAIYDIRQDDLALRQQPATPAAFDQLRRGYAHRPELSVGQVQGGSWLATEEWRKRLKQLTFQLNKGC